MRTFEQVATLRAYLRGIRAEGKTVGLVPTMGALHEGHLSLVQRARGDCEAVVVSLFVNPTQFGPGEDFTTYPRDLNADQRLTSNAGVDALFMPQVEEIYPAGFQTVVDVPEFGAVLEGAHRPGHFKGVATVVTKLLNIVQPERAYFGQKDFQQCLMIERLVTDLNLPCRIVRVPTVREPDGLAMSSRNVYLFGAERQAATLLSRLLKLAEKRVQDGMEDANTLLAELQAITATEPLARPDYIALVSPTTLQPVSHLQEAPVLLALAIRIGKTRLLDNTLLTPQG